MERLDLRPAPEPPAGTDQPRDQPAAASGRRAARDFSSESRPSSRGEPARRPRPWPDAV